jgi:fructokinase
VTIVAGVELGGTKSLAVIVEGTAIRERRRVPTTTPAETLDALSDQIAAWQAGGWEIDALGVAAFGPVGVDRRRADYGWITTTPKPGWRHTDVLGHFAGRFDLPIAFDSDVAGAALAEGRWGAARDCSVHVYLTVGTGIGGGVVVEGRPLHGLVHPEIGHVRVRRRAGDTFAGACPFHGDCIEGLAAGPAIAARAGAPAETLDPGHPVWGDVSNELAELMGVLVLSLSPERIVIGGGVGGGNPWLLPAVRAQTGTLLAGYVSGLDEAALDRLIVPPLLGDDAGPLGAAAVGLSALGP